MSLHEIPNGGPTDNDSDESSFDVEEHTPSAIGRSRGRDGRTTAPDDPRDTESTDGDDTRRTDEDAQISAQALEPQKERSDELGRSRSVTTPSEVIRPAPLPDREESSADGEAIAVEMPSRMGWRRPERCARRTGDAVSDLALGARSETDEGRDSPVYDYDPCIAQASSYLAFDC